MNNCNIVLFYSTLLSEVSYHRDNIHRGRLQFGTTLNISYDQMIGHLMQSIFYCLTEKVNFRIRFGLKKKLMHQINKRFFQRSFQINYLGPLPFLNPSQLASIDFDFILYNLNYLILFKWLQISKIY